MALSYCCYWWNTFVDGHAKNYWLSLMKMSRGLKLRTIYLLICSTSDCSLKLLLFVALYIHWHRCCLSISLSLFIFDSCTQIYNLLLLLLFKRKATKCEKREEKKKIIIIFETIWQFCIFVIYCDKKIEKV